MSKKYKCGACQYISRKDPNQSGFLCEKVDQRKQMNSRICDQFKLRENRQQEGIQFK